MLNAVLFDLDNTLVDRNRAFRECVHLNFQDGEVREEIVLLDESGAGDRDLLFRIWSERSGAPMDQRKFGQMIAGRLHPDADLLTELRSLSQRIKIGVISNGGSETQWKKLRAAGLETVFTRNRVWISEEVGSVKPGSQIFEMALSSIGEKGAHCLYIGDREDHDLWGPRSAGMRASLVQGVLTAVHLRALLKQEGER
jgi:FMN phosphatase YigB (HAD superfamily)